MGRNKEVIRRFVSRCSAESGHLVSTGNLLISYSTVIGQFVNNILYINVTKYSQTTSRHQNMLKANAEAAIDLNKIETIDNVPIGSMSLINFIPKPYEF